MYEEPIEDRYNDLLKKRIALEGELALTRRQAALDLARARKTNRRYLFLLFLLPFLTFWCSKTKYITPLEQTVSRQQDAIVKLQNDIAELKKLKVDSVQYVIKKGDMLVSIGQLFFNDTLAGYQIGIDNGITTEYAQRHLIPGDTLTIRYR